MNTTIMSVVVHRACHLMIRFAKYEMTSVENLGKKAGVSEAQLRIHQPIPIRGRTVATNKSPDLTIGDSFGCAGKVDALPGCNVAACRHVDRSGLVFQTIDG